MMMPMMMETQLKRLICRRSSTLSSVTRTDGDELSDENDDDDDEHDVDDDDEPLHEFFLAPEMT
jgi:hypothetical protein